MEMLGQSRCGRRVSVIARRSRLDGAPARPLARAGSERLTIGKAPLGRLAPCHADRAARARPACADRGKRLT